MKKGWKRLAIVLGVPYFGWWFFLLIVSPGASRRSSARFSEALANKDANDNLSMTVGMEVNLKMMQDANENFALAITWGIVVPILAALLWVLARWVHRGFQAPQPD